MAAPRAVEQLRVALSDFRGPERIFDARFSLQRRELTRGYLLRAVVRFPWLTARVIQAIHWQAFWLWRRKCPFYPHPKHRQGSEAQPQ